MKPNDLLLEKFLVKYHVSYKLFRRCCTHHDGHGDHDVSSCGDLRDVSSHDVLHDVSSHDDLRDVSN